MAIATVIRGQCPSSKPGHIQPMSKGSHTGQCDVIGRKCKGLGFTKGQGRAGVEQPPSPWACFYRDYHSATAAGEELHPISSLMQSLSEQHWFWEELHFLLR